MALLEENRPGPSLFVGHALVELGGELIQIDAIALEHNKKMIHHVGRLIAQVVSARIHALARGGDQRFMAMPVVLPSPRHRELGLDVPVRGDHVPAMEGDRLLAADSIPGYSTLGRLFANGYLKALLKGTER